MTSLCPGLWCAMETNHLVVDIIAAILAYSRADFRLCHTTGVKPKDTSLHICLRFYQELNDFLPPDKRQVAFVHPLRQGGAIKDVIEALGVPHTEVDLILADGRPVGFDYQVQDGDRISVYPVFESLDITPLTRLRPRPLRTTRFVLDTHLGRLAAYLRMVGFDSLYRNDYDDATLADISATEHRILLTRDRYLLMRKIISHGYYVRHTQPRLQLREVLERFDLLGQLQPFTRCMHCNGLLEKVDKAAVLERIPQETRAWLDDYWQCRQCARVYWKGTHYRRMCALIEGLREIKGSEHLIFKPTPHNACPRACTHPPS